MKNINLYMTNCKPETMSTAADMVYYAVRTYELNSIIKSADWKDCIERLDTAHPGCDVWTLNEESIRPALGDDTTWFVKKRTEAVELTKTLATLPTEEQYNALSETDKMFVCIYAHTIMTGIKLDKSVLKDMDIASAVGEFYKRGSLKKSKECFRAIFNHVCGKDGDLFYGIRLRRSDFSDEDIRTCLAGFRGTAAIRVKKDKDGNETFIPYNWVNRDKNTQAQALCITNLFGVVLSSRLKDWTRPTVDTEEKVESEKVETPKESASKKSESKKSETPKKTTAKKSTKSTPKSESKSEKVESVK